MYGDFIDDKTSRLDVKAVLNDGTKVLIEMQVSSYDELPERFLYYWGKGYTEDLKSGDKYKELHKTISIIILVNNLPRFKDIEHIKTFMADIGFNNIEIHKFIEMKEQLTSFEILGVKPEKYDELLENAIVAVIRI